MSKVLILPLMIFALNILAGVVFMVDGDILRGIRFILVGIVAIISAIM